MFNIGIFGDSYADCHLSVTDKIGWPKHLITQAGGEGEVYGRSGTSTWWSYEKFLKNFHRHDVIVFCYSNFSRWPILPEKCVGQHFCVSSDNGHEEIKPYIPFYTDLLNSDFLHFTQKNVFKSINELCRKENKFLINIFTTHYDVEDVVTYYPYFHNLEEVAFSEKIFFNGKLEYSHIVHSQHRVVDNRRCHLNDENNRKLANFLFEEIKSKRDFTQCGKIDISSLIANYEI